MNINRIVIFSFLLSVASLGSGVDSGVALFEGTKPFKNGGVACISCHNVNSPMVISGGSLAKDLTMYGGEAMAPTVQFMVEKIESMPSPIMKEAYRGHELTSTEISDLIAFFKKVNPQSTDGGLAKLFWLFGLVGAGGIFGGLTLLGRKKVKRSVNQDIYDRQLKTTWKV
ncbi:cytochrome c, class I [hydrothermal vent metagenome]|uniref:Cytochrome c, class I n=1 Tax=hydrothermal vent metagenome TaxID=652676 RepID=A0A1W1C928_9ZZZZ